MSEISEEQRRAFEASIDDEARALKEHGDGEQAALDRLKKHYDDVNDPEGYKAALAERHGIPVPQTEKSESE